MAFSRDSTTERHRAPIAVNTVQCDAVNTARNTCTLPTALEGAEFDTLPSATLIGRTMSECRQSTCIVHEWRATPPVHTYSSQPTARESTALYHGDEVIGVGEMETDGEMSPRGEAHFECVPLQHLPLAVHSASMNASMNGRTARATWWETWRRLAQPRAGCRPSPSALCPSTSSTHSPCSRDAPAVVHKHVFAHQHIEGLHVEYECGVMREGEIEGRMDGRRGCRRRVATTGEQVGHGGEEGGARLPERVGH